MNPSAASADDALWRSARAGSVDAWGQLFLQHHRRIYNYCLRRTGQWSLAEDLTSAVFLEAWRRRRHIPADITSPLPWLYGISTMLTRNSTRTMRRYRRALARVPVPPPEPDPAEEAAARVDAQRRAVLVLQALERLSPEDVDVLHLAATGELSYAEMAQALALPIGTVRSRLSRARDRLAQESGRGARSGARPQSTDADRGR